MDKGLKKGRLAKEPSKRPLSLNEAAGQRLRLYRKKILKLPTIGALAGALGLLEERDNRVGNWERGAPFHRYTLQLARLRPGLNSHWFYSGDFVGTTADVMREIEAAEESGRAEGWYTISPRD